MDREFANDFLGTYRIDRVKNDAGSDITGFATEEERITLYWSCRTEELRCLVTKEFSRDRLNWERVRFKVDKDNSCQPAIFGRIAGHTVHFSLASNGRLEGQIKGNPTGTIMAEVD